MKLVAIKNIKPNQIYKHKNGNIYIISYQTHYRYEIADCYKNNILDSEENEFYSREFAEDMELIGFVNITHKLENKKLVEIPREEFEVDDIILNTKNNEKYFITEIYEPVGTGFGGSIARDIGIAINVNTFEKIYISEFGFGFPSKKIGIYGVTHEFLNSNLIKE